MIVELSSIGIRQGQRRQGTSAQASEASIPETKRYPCILFDEFKTSLPGGMAPSSCYCKPGKFWVMREGMCADCPPDYFCQEGRSVECPSNSESPQGSVQDTDCVCKEGYYGENGGTCFKCGPNQFCQGGNNYTCPDNTASSSGAGVCICEDGFTGPAGGPCNVCPAGFFCAAGSSDPCPSLTTSLPGSKSIEDCACEQGFYSQTTIASGGECRQCEVMSFDLLTSPTICLRYAASDTRVSISI